MENVHLTDQRLGGLLQWQLANYQNAHQDRKNLALHALTAPLFVVGSALALSAPFSPSPLVVLAAGSAAMLGTLVAQGRGHRAEGTRPASFRGPLDFVTRFVAEQWITFPRFVLSGGFARAWRAARRPPV